MIPFDERTIEAISTGLSDGGSIVFVTGAGISAESGIRTYRGEDGMWTTDGAAAMSKATLAYFSRYPERSWQWHLDRRVEVLRAEPNAAHLGLVQLERVLGDRFALITQNVDRLHIRAGNSTRRTVEIHGHYGGMRCTAGCTGIVPIPTEFDAWSGESSWPELRDLLVCPQCGFATRPHVLWFDEFYDEANYRMKTAGSLAARASLCVTVGTSGGVPVAARLAEIAAKAGAVLIDVNPTDGDLRRLALRSPGGAAMPAPASEAIPAIMSVVESQNRGASRI
ncbi:MAG: SIR2 family NAD-dependent protein deacylase [Acidimicrobiia bacterium]